MLGYLWCVCCGLATGKHRVARNVSAWYTSQVGRQMYGFAIGKPSFQRGVVDAIIMLWASLQAFSSPSEPCKQVSLS